MSTLSWNSEEENYNEYINKHKYIGYDLPFIIGRSRLGLKFKRNVRKYTGFNQIIEYYTPDLFNCYFMDLLPLL